MLRKHFNSILILLIIASLTTSCGEEVKRGLQPIPAAFGKINQLVIIADEDVWQGKIGDTLRYYYAAAYPILPQPEPIFDLKHFTPHDLALDPLRQELRNYLFIADLDDEDSPTANFIKKDLGPEKIRRARDDRSFNSTVGRDRWAKGQLVIYQFGFSRQELINNIKKNFAAVSKRINQADKEKIDASVYLDGISKALIEEIKEQMGVDLRIPGDYDLATNDGDVIWLRKETYDISSNILISKIAYSDQSQLTKQGIKAIRDTIGRKYISSEIPNTYMRVNDIDLPMFTYVKTVNNNYTLEARGIWEIVNDYMGGAFISYLMHNPEKKELLFIDGFVHAPGTEKRNLIMQLEHIMASVKF